MHNPHVYLREKNESLAFFVMQEKQDDEVAYAMWDSLHVGGNNHPKQTEDEK
jgi:hypothetical protein